VEKKELQGLLGRCLDRLELPGLPSGARVRRGKVRDVVALGPEMLIVTTDRISAFDRVLTTLPCKGEVLNTLSLFWFRNTSDIIANHVLEEMSARTIRAAACDVVPVEVVIRGYLTGSAWRDYQKGEPVSGIALPPGMRFNQRFDLPLLTPSTKEERGATRSTHLPGGNRLQRPGAREALGAHRGSISRPVPTGNRDRRAERSYTRGHQV
jgi:phosphoribosylaminoimidazole-succinocarboxamide synthase